MDDLITAMITCMRTPEAADGPTNIGNPTEISILELARLIIEMTGSRSKIVCHPLPQDDPVQRRPDITRAKEILNWQPTVPLEEGLRRTISYFETILVRTSHFDIAVA